MKVIAYELRVVIDELAHDDPLEATLRLHRVREIERVLVDQMAVMETLAPADYHPIRMTLGHGSGQESPGFNQILELAPEVNGGIRGAADGVRTLTLLDAPPGPPQPSGAVRAGAGDDGCRCLVPAFPRSALSRGEARHRIRGPIAPERAGLAARAHVAGAAVPRSVAA